MIEHEIFISHERGKIKKIIITDNDYAYNGVSLISDRKINKNDLLITREYNFSSPISNENFLKIKNENFFKLIKKEFSEFAEIYNLEHWMI